MRRAIIFLAVLVATNADLANHSPCDDLSDDELPTGTDFSMDVSGCHNPDLCALVRGTVHDIKYCFKNSNPSSDDTEMKVFGVFSAFTIPYGEPKDVCKTAYLSNGTTCHSSQGMIAGHRYCFDSKFNVMAWYPPIELKVKFLITDITNEVNIACLVVPVSIVDAS